MQCTRAGYMCSTELCRCPKNTLAVTYNGKLSRGPSFTDIKLLSMKLDPWIVQCIMGIIACFSEN
jgi:hypothetical protein